MSFDLILFGGTGDLAWRKLMPALFQAFRHDKLPADGRILAVARDERSDDEYRQLIQQRFQKVEASKRPSDEEFVRFAELLHYRRMDLSDADSYAGLKRWLDERGADITVFFLATSPELYKLMDSFHRSHELPVTVLRPFNTFGPRQSARAVIPTIITQALAGDVLRLGSTDPRRDLTFVEDTAAGFVAAAASEAAVGRTIQLGTGEDVSVGEIVERVGAILGRELTVETDPARVRPAQSEVQLLLSDPSLARELTGWTPAVGVDEGLARTVAWIEANASRYRLGDYVL
jgi:hypothetical protein